MSRAVKCCSIYFGGGVLESSVPPPLPALPFFRKNLLLSFYVLLSLVHVRRHVYRRDQQANGVVPRLSASAALSPYPPQVDESLCRHVRIWKSTGEIGTWRMHASQASSTPSCSASVTHHLVPFFPGIPVSHGQRDCLSGFFVISRGVSLVCLLLHVYLCPAFQKAMSAHASGLQFGAFTVTIYL